MGLAAPRAALADAACTLRCDRISAEVMAALSQANVDAILLKGPAIAQWLYPDGGRRYLDSDILVPTARLATAHRVLTALGFVVQHSDLNPADRNPRQGNTAYVRRDSHGAGAGIVELHHNLPDLPVDADALWAAFAADAVEIRVAGADVRVPSTAARALHVVLHDAQHRHHGHPVEDLRRAIAMASPEDWQAAAALATRLGIADILGAGLRYHGAGSAIADRLNLPGHELSVAWPAAGPRGTTYLIDLRGAALSQKLWLARRALLPSRPRIRHWTTPRSGPAPSLPIGYLRWWRALLAGLIPAARAARRHRDASVQITASRPADARAPIGRP